MAFSPHVLKIDSIWKYFNFNSRLKNRNIGYISKQVFGDDKWVDRHHRSGALGEHDLLINDVVSEGGHI